MRNLALVVLALAIVGCTQTIKINSTESNSSLARSLSASMLATQLQEADKLFSERKYEEARVEYEKTAKMATDSADNSTLTEAEAQTARSYGIQGKFEDGRPWLAKSKSHATDAEPRGWSRYLGVRGRFEWQDEKNIEKAKATFIEMYDYCKLHKLFSRELDAAHMVAIVAPPAEQVEWALKAVAAAEKGKETGWLAVLWNNLGWTYEEGGSFDKMLEALINARKYHYETGNDHTKLVADFGVARAYWRNGNLEEARKWLADAMTRAEARLAAAPDDTDAAEWVGWGHAYLGDILQTEGKSAEALAEFKAARPYLITAGIEDWSPELLQELDAKIAALDAAD